MIPAEFDSPREKVWVALSDLYLDTDIEPFVEPCAALLADSPFSREELARILFDEVHPALVLNLMSVAGEWGGFETSWLCERIRGQQAGSAWRRCLARRLLRRYPRTLWRRLDEIIVRLRSSRTAS
jgi:hypothetical protein